MQASPTALTTFRTAGTAWQAGVVTVLGVAGVSALLGGREDIQKLPHPVAGIVVLLAVGAAMASAANIVLALLANVGFPSVRRSSVGKSLASADLAPLKAALRSSQQLRWSVGFAAASFVLAFAGVVTMIATPDDSSLTYKIGYLNGANKVTTACGSYAHSGNQVTITPSDTKIPAVTKNDDVILETDAC